MQGFINFMLSIVAVLVIPLLLSLGNQRGEETDIAQIGAPTSPSSCSGSSFLMNLVINYIRFPRSTSTVIRMCCDQRDVSLALFHHCFKEGCNASLLLGENGDRSRSMENEAIPNQTLRGLIKKEVEQEGSGNVSCADILALVPRNPEILLQEGGPVFPVLIGKRDSHQSFSEEALETDENPRIDDMDNTTCTMHLYNLTRANERETVGLVEIGKTGCDFILQEPHPTIIAILAHQKKLNCSTHNMKNDNICTDKLVAPLVISKPKPNPKLNDIAIARRYFIRLFFLVFYHYGFGNAVRFSLGFSFVLGIAVLYGFYN